MAADRETNRAYGIAPPGYRLPDATRIGRVRLQVADLQRSLDYYERVLGLVVRTSSDRLNRLGLFGDLRLEQQSLRGAHPCTSREPALTVDVELAAVRSEEHTV